MADPVTLQTLLDVRGLPIGDVARLAKISEKALWKLREGLVREARSTTVARLAKALGTTPAIVRKAIEASAAGK